MLEWLRNPKVIIKVDYFRHEMEDTEAKPIVERGSSGDACPHESVDSDWLPLLDRGEEETLAPHPYCGNCGLVRNIGPDRAKKLGYYVEVLSEVERHLRHEHAKGGKHKLTEVQKRLIVKEMQNDDVFNDLYGVMASCQEERFVEILQKYRPDLEENEIHFD